MKIPTGDSPVEPFLRWAKFVGMLRSAQHDNQPVAAVSYRALFTIKNKEGLAQLSFPRRRESTLSQMDAAYGAWQFKISVNQ